MVKRYSVDQTGFTTFGNVEDDEGDYVSYVDYLSREQELLEQINRLISEHDRELHSAYQEGRERETTYNEFY